MVQGDPIVSSDLVIRLYAAARGLEDEGQNNIAKLFRAAALGEMYRASQNRPRQGAGLEEEVRELVGILSSRQTTSELLRTALQTGLDALERGDWPLLSQIPRVHVCRFCGRIMAGDPPERCPGCAARHLTFQEALPVFYLDPLDADVVKRALRENLIEIEQSVDGVSESTADRGVWPMRDILSHLLGAQELMAGRAKRMLAEDHPDLGSIAPTAVRARSSSGAPTMADMLQSYRASRQDLIDLVDTLSPEELQRPGYHPEWGPMTVLSQLTYLVAHEQSHLAELEDRRRGQ